MWSSYYFGLSNSFFFLFFYQQQLYEKKKENEINIEKSERKNYFIENVRIIKSINHEVCWFC
jgi:hypothetical protein